MKKKIDKNHLEELYLQYNLLSRAGEMIIRQGGEEAKLFYSRSAHISLQTEEVFGRSVPRQVFLPLPKEEWPRNFQNLADNYNSAMTWPGYSLYCYTNDVIFPPNIPHLLFHCGYAIYKNKLIKCSFFIAIRMIEEVIDGETMDIPEFFAIDPLAALNGIEPEGYVGIPVKEEYIQQWTLSRGATGNPLDNQMEKLRAEKNAERLHDSYMECYYAQMTHQPDWFPPELVKFALKEGLEIPTQSRTDTAYLIKRYSNESAQLSVTTGTLSGTTERNDSVESVPVSVKNKSQKIFILRHADCADNGVDPKLSERGIKQAKELARNIGNNLGSVYTDITIWTSTARRADETATIIWSHLRCSLPETYEKLWSDNRRPFDFDWLKEKINQFEGECLIIISHLEYVQEFPGFLHWKFKSNNADYAEGVLIENKDTCSNFR